MFWMMNAVQRVRRQRRRRRARLRLVLLAARLRRQRAERVHHTRSTAWRTTTAPAATRRRCCASAATPARPRPGAAGPGRARRRRRRRSMRGPTRHRLHADPEPVPLDADGSSSRQRARGKYFARPVVRQLPADRAEHRRTERRLLHQLRAVGADPTTQDGSQPNTKSCVTTVIDRFTTSYNWAQVNFGSIWLRPWFYLFLQRRDHRSALRRPHLRHRAGAGSRCRRRTSRSPRTASSSAPASTAAANVRAALGADLRGHRGRQPRQLRALHRSAQTTCNLESRRAPATGRGGFNPKRLINIYDGPHFADGNLFLNVGAWECDPQPCQGKRPGQCVCPMAALRHLHARRSQPARRRSGRTTRSAQDDGDRRRGRLEAAERLLLSARLHLSATRHFFKKVPTGCRSHDRPEPVLQLRPRRRLQAPTLSAGRLPPQRRRPHARLHHRQHDNLDGGAAIFRPNAHRSLPHRPDRLPDHPRRPRRQPHRRRRG